jgi:hypothetical protein
MQLTLLGLGVALIVAAIVGGGLAAAGITFPPIASRYRQVLLGVFGVLLLLLALLVVDGDDKTSTAATSTTENKTVLSSSAGGTGPTSSTSAVVTAVDASGSASSSANADIVVGASLVDASLDPRAGEVFLLPPGAIAPEAIPPRNDDLRMYLLSRGAVAAGDQNVVLYLRSASPRQVVIRSIVPKVVEKLTPPAGSLVRHSYGCGAPPVRSAFFDMDVAPPTVAYTTGEEQGGDEPHRELVLTVGADEPEVVSVVAKSEMSDTRWIIGVNYEIDGRLSTLDVSNNGTPFRVTGVAPGASIFDYYYDSGSEPTPPGIATQQPYSFC